MSDKIQKTDAEWRAQLTDDAYRVTRQAGTERPFTGKFYRESPVGIYGCVCCDTPIFASDAKFEAGCGWPSFWQPLDGARLDEVTDTSHGMCASRCVMVAMPTYTFPDGLPLTGLRYCINSVALTFLGDNPASE